MKYPTGAFKLCPFMVIGMMLLCLGGILREISLVQYYVAAHSLWCKLKNKPSLCMNNCLFQSQLYDREHLFWISMPNKISVSGSLSHITKVCENVKSAM